LVDLLGLNRWVAPEHRRSLFQRRWLNYSLWGVQLAWGLWILVGSLSYSSTVLHQVRSIPLTNPLYGIWSVEEFTGDGQVRPPLPTDSLRWQRVIFTSPQAVMIQTVSGQFVPYTAILDTGASTLSLKRVETAHMPGPWWSEWVYSNEILGAGNSPRSS